MTCPNPPDRPSPGRLPPPWAARRAQPVRPLGGRSLNPWAVPGSGAVPLPEGDRPMSALSLVAAQEQFTATLSAVEDAVHYAFHKRLRPQEYREALAEARAAAWHAWHGLIRRGKDPLEVGGHGVANNAIRYVRNRRQLGCGTSGRGAMDIYHPTAQRKDGFRLVSLDAGEDGGAEDSMPGAWREWLAEDNRVSPADEACFRVDFAAWL